MSTLRRGTVTRVLDDSVYCTIPSIGGPDAELGPLPRASMSMVVGDRIVLAQVGGELESFVAIASLKDYLSNQATIYYFEDEAARDATFPGPNPLPTFVWIDDLAEFQVWTDEGGDHWQTVSWDETRIDAIEANVASHETRLDTNDTDIFNLQLSALNDDSRLTALEGGSGFTLTDSATIDFTKVGKDITAIVKANSIPINDLSDVVVSSPSTDQVITYNGTTWVNALLDQDALSDTVVTSPATGDVLRYNGTNFVNVSESTLLPNANGVGALAVSSGTDTRNNAAFGNLAGTGSVTSFSVTKKYAGTKLRIDMSATFFVAGTSVGVRFGVLIGGTDYEVCRLAPTQTAGVHLSCSGTIYISGIAAGSTTVQGRWATLGGQVTRDTADWLTISAEEVGA